MPGIKANFVFNVVGTLIPLGVALATVPLYISYIGTARYGILSIVWILLGYFGVLDLGLSRASANALAKLEGSRDERAKVLVTVFWINLCLGALGGLILYFSGSLLIDHLLTMPPDLNREITTAFPWIATLLPLALMGGVGVGALEAREKFLAVNVLQAVGTILGQVLPVLCAALISPSLSTVVPAAVLSRGLSILLTLGFVAREEWPLHPRSFDWKRGRSLLSYGGWVSVSNIVDPLLASMDQLLIGSVVGVAAVSHYAVPMNLVTRSQILAFALARTLFPRMSRSRPKAARALAQNALVKLAYGYGAVCAPAILLAKPFIAFWIGEDFAAVAGPVAEILLVGGWINGLAFIPYALLQGQGRPDLVAKFHALELIPFTLVLWLLANQFGLLGAAAAWVLRCTADAALLFIAARFRAMQLLPVLLPFAFILAAYLLVRITTLTVVSALIVAVFLGVGVAIGSVLFDRETRELLGNFIVYTTNHKRWGAGARVDDSAGTGAPATEIEITPEMIEAGFKVLVESGITEYPLEGGSLLVAEIFYSMYSARQQ